jgi:transcriptional repressor NrdR
MSQLRDKDYVAYVRFASVYRNFQDIDEFVEELEDLSEARIRLELKKNQAELPL